MKSYILPVEIQPLEEGGYLAQCPILGAATPKGRQWRKPWTTSRTGHEAFSSYGWPVLSCFPSPQTTDSHWLLRLGERKKQPPIQWTETGGGDSLGGVWRQQCDLHPPGPSPSQALRRDQGRG